MSHLPHWMHDTEVDRLPPIPIKQQVIRTASTVLIALGLLVAIIVLLVLVEHQADVLNHRHSNTCSSNATLPYRADQLKLLQEHEKALSCPITGLSDQQRNNG